MKANEDIIALVTLETVRSVPVFTVCSSHSWQHMSLVHYLYTMHRAIILVLEPFIFIRLLNWWV